MPRSNEQSERNERVEVTEFTTAEVETVLTETGFDSALFHKRQLELLRLPQNLSLFLEAAFDVSHAPVFGTAKELFDRYWTEKRRSVASRVTLSPDPWLEVMQTLCDAMTAAQQLSVPTETPDRFAPDYLDQLASEGVLTFDGRRYGFGHESFFDYCFARVFFTRSESLVSFLRASEQHLFRRAQVRQVLAYLRDADAARYARELRGLLSDEGIRAHIKDLAFALLAEVTGPTEEEWVIWNEWVEPELAAIKAGTPNPDKLSTLAWRRFFGSSSWFAFADERKASRLGVGGSGGTASAAPCGHSRRRGRTAPSGSLWLRRLCGSDACSGREEHSRRARGAYVARGPRNLGLRSVR